MNSIQPVVYATAIGLTGVAIVIFRKKLYKAFAAAFLVASAIFEYAFTRIRITRRHEKNVYHILSTEHMRDWTVKLPFFNITFLSTPRSLQDPVEWDNPNLDAVVQNELQDMNGRIFKHLENQYSMSRERINIRSSVEPGDGEIIIAIRVRMPINRENRVLTGQALVRTGDMRQHLPKIFYTEWWNKKRLST